MRIVFAAFALAAAACSRDADSAAPAATAQTGAGAETPAVDPITDRFWTLTPGDGRPGAFRLFLSSGAMMEGSCVETYRVSAWRRDETGGIVWNEDGKDISADIVSVDGEALALGLNLTDGQKVETYAPLSAPFVCPDMPR